MGIAETWQPVATEFSVSADCGILDNGTVSVQASEDGRTIVSRVVNESPDARAFLVDFGKPASITVTSISFSDTTVANTPANPTRVVPTQPQRVVQGQAVTLPGYSYSVFV